MGLYDEIAKTAHEIYEKSGWIPGRDLDNWIEAERIVLRRLNGGGSQKEHPEASVEAPIKKAAPAGEKKAVDPKKAAAPKKASAKRTAKPKKSN